MNIIFSLFWDSFTLIDISRCSGSFFYAENALECLNFWLSETILFLLGCWNMGALKLSPPPSFPLSSPLPPSLILFVPIGELLCSRFHILFDNDQCPKKSLMSVCIGIGNSA